MRIYAMTTYIICHPPNLPFLRYIGVSCRAFILRWFATAVENKCRKIMMEAVSDYFAVLSYHSPVGRELNWEELYSIIQYRFWSFCLIQGLLQWKSLFRAVWMLYGEFSLFILWMTNWLHVKCYRCLWSTVSLSPNTRARRSLLLSFLWIGGEDPSASFLESSRLSSVTWTG
jgi:hypothetical protein